MSRYEPELIITQSLLDRLTDEEPHAARDAQSTRAQSFRQFKTALRRDLEWLLNTRQTPEAAEKGEIAESLFNYGLPDLTALSAQSSRDRNRLIEVLQQTIERFEPRLTNVKVYMESVPQGLRAVHFRIEGLANIDPAPEHVSFDTVLELTSGEYEVK